MADLTKVGIFLLTEDQEENTTQGVAVEELNNMENTEYLELIRFLNAELGVFVGYNHLSSTGDIASYKQKVNHIFAEVEF